MPLKKRLDHSFDHLRKTSKNRIFFTLRGVAQLVARDVWDVDAAGSNPVTPTKNADTKNVSIRDSDISEFLF